MHSIWRTLKPLAPAGKKPNNYGRGHLLNGSKRCCENELILFLTPDWPRMFCRERTSYNLPPE